MRVLSCASACSTAKLSKPLPAVKSGSATNLCSLSGASSMPAPPLRDALSCPLILEAPDIPTNMDELLSPLSRRQQLPGWAGRYLSLLAESTNSQGAMHAHLLKMFARGTQLAQLVTDPVGEVADVVAEASSDVLLRHLARAQAMVEQEDALVTAAEQRHQERSGASAPCCMRPATAGPMGWRRVRAAVLTTGCFRSAAAHARSRDDSCLPQKANIDPVHRRALTIMLSVLLSGACQHLGSGGGHAVAGPILDAPMHDAMVHVTMDESSSQHLQQQGGSLFHGMKIQQAPSIGRSAANGATGDVGGSGGMAVSTALKLLRSDSKGSGRHASETFRAIMDRVGDGDSHGSGANGGGAA